MLLVILGSLASLAPAPAPAQAPPPAQVQPQPPKAPLTALAPQPKPNRVLILLDPAHGGPDPGAHLPGNLLEKDVTLAFASRLRGLLSAGNFAVISTRTADSATVFTTDQRAEIANHDRPAVCLVLHASSSGAGVHLFTSALELPSASARPKTVLRWNAAQVPSLSASRLLANDIGLSLLQAKLPVILGQASIAPLDNLTCPAIAIELSPLTQSGSAPTPISDAAYQQSAAQAIVTALTSWRNENTADGVTR